MQKLPPDLRLIFFLKLIEMQGQENRKADILGMETALSNEAAEFLLDEDAQVVNWIKKQRGREKADRFIIGIYRITVSCYGIKRCNN